MKERGNEDGSEWDRDSDMRFRLCLNAMNLQKGELECQSKKPGNVWLEVVEGAQVHLFIYLL